MARIKINRYAQTIKVQGEDEVYTRYSKREYQKRREMFDDPDWNQPAHLSSYSYDEWTEWGAQGGRPANETPKQKEKALAGHRENLLLANH